MSKYVHKSIHAQVNSFKWPGIIRATKSGTMYCVDHFVSSGKEDDRKILV
jgi:hypothetical protein